MLKFNIKKWAPGRQMPDGIQREWVAERKIAGDTYKITLTDAVSVSGRHYKNVSVFAPHQGRGNKLEVEINGVSLSLWWNGGNYPKFPAEPEYANYQRRPLTNEQVEQMKTGKKVTEAATATVATDRQKARSSVPAEGVRGPQPMRARQTASRRSHKPEIPGSTPGPASKYEVTTKSVDDSHRDVSINGHHIGLLKFEDGKWQVLGYKATVMKAFGFSNEEFLRIVEPALKKLPKPAAVKYEVTTTDSFDDLHRSIHVNGRNLGLLTFKDGDWSVLVAAVDDMKALGISGLDELKRIAAATLKKLPKPASTVRGLVLKDRRGVFQPVDLEATPAAYVPGGVTKMVVVHRGSGWLRVFYSGRNLYSYRAPGVNIPLVKHDSARYYEGTPSAQQWKKLGVEIG